MPEPDYADGDGDVPGFWGCVIAFLLLFGSFLLFKGCS